MDRRRLALSVSQDGRVFDRMYILVDEPTENKYNGMEPGYQYPHGLVEEDRIVNDCFNKLTRGNDVITGYGLECDHDLSAVDIKRNVEARFVDDEQGLIGDEGSDDGK